MAPSFTNTKVLSALIQTKFSNVLTRRGYAAAAATQSATATGMSSSKKSGEDKVIKGGSTDKVSWVPDPVTGYYKPENIKDIDDVAELRATLPAK